MDKKSTSLSFKRVPSLNQINKFLLPILLLCSLFFSPLTSAREIFLYTDNDTYFNTDEEYTGGGGAVIDFFGVSLVYNYMLFTPQNTDTTVPPAGQRPYAAYEKYGVRYRNNIHLLYFNMGAFGARTGDQLNGEFIQNFIHKGIADQREEADDFNVNDVISHGWPTQISDKNGVQGDLQLGLFHEFGDIFSVLVYGLGESGNFIESIGFGVTSRLGFNIDKFSDNNFAPKNALFIELDYHASDFSKNNLLQGNESSYPFAVRIEDQVQKASISLIGVWAGFKLQAGATYITEEYQSQPTNDSTSDGHIYGTVGLGYRW